MDDIRRREFLDALDDSDKVEVNEWEAGFINNTIDCEMFSPSQRQVIDNLVKRYGNKVDW